LNMRMRVKKMVMVAEQRTRLDVSRTWMLVRVHRKVFRGLRSVPPLVRQVDHLGNCHTDRLAPFKLGRYRTEAEGYLVAFQRHKVALDI